MDVEGILFSASACLWKSLEKLVVPLTKISIIGSFHEGFYAKGHEFMESISLCVGLCQGCTGGKVRRSPQVKR